VDIGNLSEFDIKTRILKEIREHNQIFNQGWYDPPPSGHSSSTCSKTFTRLLYETKQKQDYWPQETFTLNTETVRQYLYLNGKQSRPICSAIWALLFIGVQTKKLKEHLKNCYFAILEIAKHAQVGMKFS